MSDDETRFTLPTAASVAIALVAGGIGILLWRYAIRLSNANPSGYDGYVWLGLLLFAGAAFLVAALALHLARNRVLYWIGVAAILGILAL